MFDCHVYLYVTITITIIITTIMITIILTVMVTRFINNDIIFIRLFIVIIDTLNIVLHQYIYIWFWYGLSFTNMSIYSMIPVHTHIIYSIYIYMYCEWKKSCTTLDGWTTINSVINHLSAGAGFLPSIVWSQQILVGGLEHVFFKWFSIHWECHHPNWRTPSFLRGVGIPPTRIYGSSNHLITICINHMY